jgi:chromosome segregation ATPase
MEIVTRLGQLETKIDTLCNKTADPSGTTNSDSPSKETDTEGGNTEKESPGDSNNAVALHHSILNLRRESDELKEGLEKIRKSNDAAIEDLQISQSQMLKEKMDALRDLESSMTEQETKMKQLTGNLPAAPPRLMITNGAQSRYAVRIPP